ncbi:hypothetical protein IMZ48_43380 [Candidatus Bathyarchaeota archaeon]|nr:hypothetical protein [Candidatus Bathyarchaeota archaeon]
MAGRLTYTRGAVYSGISAGRGKFVAAGEIATAPCVVFTVAKNRLKRTISVDIQSGPLSRTIANALGTYLGPGGPHPLDLRTLLANYDTLKQHLEFLQSHLPGNPETHEFRLLVEDFLQDRAVYEGLGLEQPDRPYVVSQTQLRDLHERSLDTGLDALDDCFRLGAIPFDMGDDNLNELTKRYSQIALSGDIDTPNGPYGPTIHPESLVPPRDHVFPSSGADPEPPGSYQSFSNLALRIKGPQATGLFLKPPETLPNPAPPAFDSMDRLFKVGSPFRPSQPHEQYALDDSTVGLSSGNFTSLSVLEDMNMPIGFGDVAPLPRARASSFHPGMASMDPTLSMPLDLSSCGYITSRSEGIPERDMGLMNWETESEPVFFGAQTHSPLSPVSLPVTTFHNVPSVSQGYGPGIPKKEKQSPHLLRQQLGRNLIASLTELCKMVRDTIGISEAGSMESSISFHFTSFKGVWDGGVRVFRQIIDNHPPRSLFEVLDCLVVASAMCTATASYKDQDDGSMYLE